MSNTALSIAEIAYLKKAVIDQYCRTTNQDSQHYMADLTGSIKHYDFMADVINTFLNDRRNAELYLETIAESPIKIAIRKWLGAHGHYPDKPSVSGSTLQKLLFKDHVGAVNFKDFFVVGCYIFTGIDKTKPPTGAIIPKPETPGYPRNVSAFTLVPCDGDTKTGDKIKFKYANEAVVLNRTNLDSDNNTITSKVQAKIMKKNGGWFIENVSELKSTQIKVLRPMQIRHGDVIVFGNQAFMFEEDKPLSPGGTILPSY